MPTINKLLTFCYAHRLPKHDGLCRNLHGHNARVEIELAGDGDMVIDTAEIKKVFGGWIDRHLDHAYIHGPGDDVARHIADRFSDMKRYAMDRAPTVENIAELLLRVARSLFPPNISVVRVRVWETDTSYAEAR